MAAVLELELPWQQASEAEEEEVEEEAAVGAGVGGRSLSCRSRSKLQQTSGKALPLSGRDREVDKAVSESECTREREDRRVWPHDSHLPSRCFHSLGRPSDRICKCVRNVGVAL